MKTPRRQKFLAFFLAIALSLTLIPAQVLAIEIDQRKESLQIERAEAASAEPAQDAEIVSEIPSGRDAYQKEFLLSNGQRMLAVYPTAVHYQENGQWEEIDNTLRAERQNGSTVYRNTAGAWDVALPAQMDAQQAVSVEQDGYRLSFRFAGSLRRAPGTELYAAATDRAAEISRLPDSVTEALPLERGESIQTAAVRDTQATVDTVQAESSWDAMQRQIRPEGMHSVVEYASIYENTDLKYDLMAEKLKESVIIRQKDEALLGYRYHLDSQGLRLALQEDNSILAYAADAGEDARPVYYMPAPFLVDENEAYCDDVQVRLLETAEGYDLYYLLPGEWMADSSRAYPVVLDPVLQPVANTSTIRDQSVFEKLQNSHYWGMVECGWTAKHGKERIFMKFSNLPKLTSADVIVNATVSMLKCGVDDPIDIEAHQVNGDWDSATITWSNQPSHNANIEDFQTVSAEKWYTWTITNIAQSWYEDNRNTGVMFKMPDWVEAGSEHWEEFYSSDYSPAYSPVLTISYINNCGLESIWDYTAQSAGTAGTGQINNYTGNLVWSTNSFGFAGNRMPVSVTHIYNANDKDSNASFTGYGWRTNFNQRVYPFTQDTSYYIWEDGDGTRHYLKYKSSGTYEDELIPGLILTTTGSGETKYCLTDKSGNKSYFTDGGYLVQISNNQATASNISVSYDGVKLYRVRDGIGRTYIFSYNTDGYLSKIAFLGTGTTELAAETFTYSGGNLVSIQSTLSGAATFGYTSNHLLSTATDAQGYQVRYTYNTVGANQPNRVTGVAEYHNDTAGGTLAIEYAHNQTVFQDHSGNKEIHQFNNFGSTVSIQDGQGNAQFYRYAGESGFKAASQMTLSSKMQNTVVNLVRNGSFEWEGAFWTGDSGNASTGSWGNTKEYTYLEWEALKITRTENGTAYSVRATDDAACPVQPGKTYTLSAYVKTTGMTGSGSGAQLLLKRMSTGATVAQSRAITDTSDWTRLEVTYTHPADAAADSLVVHLSNRSAGTAYFDCVQLEQSANASRYNIMENGDFRTGTWSNWPTFGWRFSSACTSSDTKVAAGTSAAPQMDGNALRIIGGTSAAKNVYQNILISGKAGDVYTLGCWAKGDSVPLTSGTGRKFGIVLRFINNDVIVGEETASFNPDCSSQNDWQYLSMRVAAKTAYTSMRIILVYECNANVVYFDGVQLFKEEFGHSYVYDANGNIISVTDLQKKNTTYEYANNNLTKITLPSGAKQTYTYDSYHNVSTATSPEGMVSSFTYDTYGNNTKVTVGSSSQTQKISATAAYTSDGNQLASVTDALGNTTAYGYDTQTGVLNWVQSPGQTDTTRTNYTYDSRFRTTGVSQGSAQVGYTYSGELLDAISSASGTEYSFDYGAFDLVNSVQVGQRTLISHTYSTDANRNLTQSTYGNGDSVSYTYDSLGRTTGKSYENGDTVDYIYDNNGNLGILKDSATGRNTQYFYDFQDRLMRYEESGQGYSNAVQWGYDDENNLSSQTQTLNGNTYITQYTYDKDNRLTKTTVGNVSAGYTYDAYGRMTGIVTKSGDSTVLNSTISYNSPSNTATSTQVADWNDGLTTYSYIYNDNGNIASISSDNRTATYEYDTLNRLARANDPIAGKTWVYSYDSGGNILKRSEYAYTANALGTPSEEVTYTYGDSQWKDLLTAYNGKPITYDEIGNPLTYDGWTYTWQHGRQLVGMEKEGSSISYAYNTDGRRISKTVNGTTYNYHYLGDQLVEMAWGANRMHFTYDAVGPMSVNFNGTEYFYLKNAQGDVTGLVDSTGAKVVAYTYGPWGESWGVSGTLASTLGAMNPLRYRGYVYDAETGLYYLNSRYYNPTWGRFINADVIMGANSDAGTYNLFAYCGNNPVIRCDKGGMLWNNLALIICILPFELHAWNTIAVWVGVDTAAIGGKVLNITKKGDTYHADFDCWQQYFGYNDFYDLVFQWATSCEPKKFPFAYNGQEYVIWAWKGDYINMGAGAEMGIYTGGGPHWRVDKNLAMPMWVWLKYDGKTIVSHNDTTWWITGFNPNYLNKNENSLTAIFSIRFNDPGMYYAFSATKPAGWKFGLMQGVGVAYFIF